MKSVLRYWLPLAFAITGLCLFTYIAVQQEIRLSANDPQIQLSEDIANHLSQVQDAAFLNQQGRSDISKSLSTYIAVFDKDKKLIAANGVLNNKPIAPPSGVFDEAHDQGQVRVTWQPQPGVRSAIVVTAYSGKNSGYVLVGRSLREVEKRENLLTFKFILSWLGILAGSLILTYPLLPKPANRDLKKKK